ncbi:MAG: rod shape-determining protein MreC [Deltaproteobacteria bacterium]|nr:rod shape-determining protein MreC [Deltaproteobacteria bacterium]
MFSKKALLIVGLIVLSAFSLTILLLPNKPHGREHSGSIVLSLAAPLQKAVTHSVDFVKDIWHRYFYLITISDENNRLRRELRRAMEINHELAEAQLTNERLRQLLHFKQKLQPQMVAAEIVGRDPNPWFKAVVIDKGRSDGLMKGLPVVVAEGIVGQVIEVSDFYAKVLLMIDRNSAVDALVQRTRARGVVKGGEIGNCVFRYVLRKEEIQVGDIIVSSGLDGVFPKGLRVGQASEIVRRNAGIFQEVFIASFVDFEKLEEVLVVLTPPRKPTETEA